MQAVAAEFSGYAGKFRCFFRANSFKQVVSIHSILKQALKLTRSVCLKAF